MSEMQGYEDVWEIAKTRHTALLAYRRLIYTGEIKLQPPIVFDHKTGTMTIQYLAHVPHGEILGRLKVTEDAILTKGESHENY